MPECRWCKREGASLSLDARGVCRVCAPEVALRIDTQERRLQKSVRLAERSSGIMKQLERWTKVAEHAEDLQPMEARGIATRGPPPSHYLHLYRRSRDRILNEEIARQVDDLLAEAEEAPVREAVSLGRRAGQLVAEAREAGGDNPTLRELALKVRRFVNEVQFQEFLGKARKAERRGQRERALEQYQGALYFLLNDDIDDRVQRHEIRAMQDKIEDLQQGA